MATSKIVLQSVEQFMSGYTPIYKPLYPLFLGKSQSYSEQAGQIDFKRINAVGDIRNRHITPKDTTLHVVSSIAESKTFKKYFLASQYQQSSLQDQAGIADVTAQVLDEHQKHQDELFLLGEGTSDSTMVNNGLYWSGDDNYELNPESTPSISDAEDLHEAVMETAALADQVAGRKALIFYGEDTLALFDSVYTSQPVPFKKVLAEVLGSNYSLVKMPAPITPASAEGWAIANLDQVKLHYTTLPKLAAQNVNDEKMYSWHNFLMGSMMLEVLAKYGVVRQDATIS